jgi:hypothetical protein
MFDLDDLFTDLFTDETTTQETDAAYVQPDFTGDAYGYAPVVESTEPSDWEASAEALADELFGKR